ASALLQINTTAQEHQETLRLEGIPGDLVFTVQGFTDATSLPQGLLASKPLREAGMWKTLFQGGGVSLRDSATVTGIRGDGTGQANEWRVDDGGRHYFITKVTADAQGGNRLEVQGEDQALTLQPQSFLLQLVGQFTVKDPTQTDRAVENRD